MKRTFVLTLVMALLVIAEVANAATSHELVGYDDLESFCQYQGMLGNLADVDKEFKMLLEPPNYPNFQGMYTIVSQLLERARTSEKHLAVLKNPTCNISKYISGLLMYYDAYKTEIKENIRNTGTDRDIVSVIESFKKKLGIKFLSSIVFDRQRVRLNNVCGSYINEIAQSKRNGHFDNIRSFNCEGGVLYTVTELIDTVQLLTEEVEKLKQRISSMSKSECTTNEVCTKPGN